MFRIHITKSKIIFLIFLVVSCSDQDLRDMDASERLFGKVLSWLFFIGIVVFYIIPLFFRKDDDKKKD